MSRLRGRRAEGPSPRIRGECVHLSAKLGPHRTIPANTGRISLLIMKLSPGWDHPREYGENYISGMIMSDYTGPSPRIRGEYTLCELHTNQRRTIPANTGRISRSLRVAVTRWDHPREYGENQLICKRDGHRGGPSPRIRGELHRADRFTLSVGTIPANTGRMRSSQCGTRPPPDHPREYGENRGSVMSMIAN